jgi:hypothetical protein
MVHHRAMLAVWADDQRKTPRALPVEHGYLWHAQSSGMYHVCPSWFSRWCCILSISRCMFKSRPRPNSFRQSFSCLSVSGLRLKMWGSDCLAERFRSSSCSSISISLCLVTDYSLFSLLQVLQAVLNMYSIPEHLFTQVCVIVDKVCQNHLSLLEPCEQPVK